MNGTVRAAGVGLIKDQILKLIELYHMPSRVLTAGDSLDALSKNR